MEPDRILMAVATGWLLCAGISKATESPGPSRLTFGPIDSWHIDQDQFAPGNEDRNYTMGVMFGWEDGNARSHILNSGGLLTSIDRIFSLEHKSDAHMLVTLGHSAFTPDLLQSKRVVAEDRPYASLLYASTSLITETEKKRSARGSKLIIGVLGLPIGEWVQTQIHRGWRSAANTEEPYDPKGWNHQISDGGEPTFMYQASWYRRPRLAGRFSSMDIVYSWDMSVGYYTNASVAGAVKFGRINPSKPFWSTLIGLNPQSDAAPITTLSDSRKAEPEPELSFVVGARLRAVAYNALMQGQFRNTDHDFEPSDIERAVLELSLGLNWEVSRQGIWSFTCTQRSAEHKRDERRAHRWCGINYHLRDRH